MTRDYDMYSTSLTNFVFLSSNVNNNNDGSVFAPFCLQKHFGIKSRKICARQPLTGMDIVQYIYSHLLELCISIVLQYVNNFSYLNGHHTLA